MTTNQKNNGKIIAIIAMMFLFAMIAFVTNLAAPFGLIWGNQYSWAGMMGNMMNFLAYLFMGIPAGTMLVKIGYKKTALTAMAVGFVGLFIQYLSSIIGADTALFSVGGQEVYLNLIIYLLGAFICGFCVCMLNTVVNPMLNLLGGGGNKGNQLIQTGGTLNSLAATLTPLFVGVLIGSVTDKTAMSDVTPLLFIAMAIEQAGTTENTALREALLNLEYDMDTLMIPWSGIEFNEYGQNTQSNGFITQYYDGAYRTVYPEAGASMEPVYPMPEFAY